MEIPISFHGRRLTIYNINKAKHEDNYTCEADVAGRNGSVLIHTVHLIVGGKHNVACVAVRRNQVAGLPEREIVRPPTICLNLMSSVCLDNRGKKCRECKFCFQKSEAKQVKEK